MGFVELFLIGVGLSMDAFAVAICRGLSMDRFNRKHALTIGLYFGGFQALMPFLGWALGSQFAEKIQSIDHWIAFVLLALIGINMIREAFGKEEEAEEAALAQGEQLDHMQLLLMAVATSIDALAVGVTFAFLDVSIVPAICMIGTTTFLISVAGVAVGHHFGAIYKRRAEVTGGVILILLSLKILLDHLGIL